MGALPLLVSLLCGHYFLVETLLAGCSSNRLVLSSVSGVSCLATPRLWTAAGSCTNTNNSSWRGGPLGDLPRRGLILVKLSIPSNLLISSEGINFVTPTANFCLHLLGLLYKISKNFKNKLSFKYFSLLMLFHAKKWFI